MDSDDDLIIVRHGTKRTAGEVEARVVTGDDGSDDDLFIARNQNADNDTHKRQRIEPVSKKPSSEGSSQPVQKSNPSMSLILSMVGGKQLTNNNYVHPLKHPKMYMNSKCRTVDDQIERNVEIFLNFFRTTVQSRRKTTNDDIPLHCIPNPEKFENFFRHQVAIGYLAQQLRLGNLSISTIRRAAASAVLFLCYAKLEQSSPPTTESIEEETLAMFKSYTDAQKADVVAKFILWYEQISPNKVSAAKVLASKFTTCRIETKETGTLTTVVRGLLTYLIFVGGVSPSTCKSPTDESRTIWMCVKGALQACEKRKGGCLSLTQHTLSSTDLVRLMQEMDSVNSRFAIQSIMLALFLVGFGLRVGSIRNRWTPGFEKQKNNEQVETDDSEDDELLTWDDDNDSEEIEVLENFDDDDDEVEDQNGEQKKARHEKKDDMFLDIEFDCLKAKNVKIFRLPRNANDPQNTVRMRVELEVSSSKTHGYKLYKPQVHGFNYPQILPDQSYDWSPNAAISLAALSVLCGATDARKITEKEYEPSFGTEKLISESSNEIGERPLFQASTRHGNLTGRPMRNVTNGLQLVADTLKLPASFFTSRSYRCGFAKGTIYSALMHKEKNEIFTVENAKQCLFTSSRWRSTQAEKYIRQLTECVLSKPVADGLSVIDWHTAIFQTSIFAKNDYSHLQMPDLYEYVIANSEDKPEAEKNWKSMSKSQKRHLLNVTNGMNFLNSPTKSASYEEQVEFLSKRPILDVIQSFKQLGSIKDQECEAFAGFGSGQTEPSFRCPVYNCKNPCHPSKEGSYKHWLDVHEMCKKRLTYLCPRCDDGECGTSNHRNFLRHLKKRHPKRPMQFKFQFVENYK
ncbi:hypothetical protein L3Y34_002813 [Caenorhabditis briggsae]|uniref:Uncharacterized protein n=1 Tax=Caenorhabditis briggsae TaxID=6238 RepID=A0AAE9A8V5_CAEBR|nr:hypothetical protein L3Y34_002813 [Caenorhabditis briggsae]